MDTDRFARARVLIGQSRYAPAVAEITARLAEDPDDPEGHILLALGRHLGNQPGAWEAARRAVELAPNEDRAHYAVSLTETRRADLDAAEAAVRRAIELNSWAAGYFGHLAAIHAARYRWDDALRAADDGLAIDPDDDVCLNNRAVALTKLGRHDEAARTLEGTLAKHPEDAFSHANRGWSLLHENEPRKAVEHFRESLRLDPNSEWAKRGLLESLRAKNWFYRRVLQLFLKLSRFPPKVQFGLIIGMVILIQVLDGLGKQMPAAEPVFNLLIFGYVVVVAATWFAGHLMNVLLLFDRDGRVLLDRSERWVSCACAAAVLAVLVLAAFAAFTRGFVYVASATFLFLTAIHFASVVNIPAGRFRWLGIATSAIFLGLFAWERIERLVILSELDELQSQEDECNAQIKDYLSGKALRDEETNRKMSQTLNRKQAVVERAVRDCVERGKRLNTWETVLIFGGLGVLLLHPFLASKARRIRFE